MINHFCNIIYEIWMEEAVLRERILAPGFLTDPLMRQAYLGSMWIGPSQGQIDPVKETAAAQARVDGLFSTIAAESAGMGSDFDQNIKQIRKERKKIAELPQIAPVTSQPAVVTEEEDVDDIDNNVDDPTEEDIDED